MSEKRTALYEKHLASGGKMIAFSGWEMPVQYEGIIEEHEAVRYNAGMFDVSHMGEVRIEGKDATAFVQHLFTNDIGVLMEGQVQYGMMLYENGTVVDDLLVYKYSETDYFLVINAGNIDKDVAWIEQHASAFNVTVTHLSDAYSEIAVQGPKAESILQKLTDFDLSSIGFFHFVDGVVIDGAQCLVSRTGYTGEDGFEVYAPHDTILKLWDTVLNAGKAEGLKPCGLGARDTLRFEASLPLYGHEISDSITPLEAGLGFFVKLDKTGFIGQEALKAQKATGLKRKIVGFEMEKGIPRQGYEVYAGETLIGTVTTGYFSPTLKKNIGLALVGIDYTSMGTAFEVKVRKKLFPATVISKRFYQKQYKK
ncbi:glycine cleavage system aminomethyltransferase GcvT [Fusibacter paucivorans]|uniref:Aminomethyltransferase n=1 Tax=Fusibacter paucivorans TaxID=76009 RepID=A0ABS5PRX2_9FIRM|nr:glycine cleavage system aminomethyltransferase GcvT [Fusibacter paucivorans]MBS7527909.1 glycine cleavage system aminomethyltransferase GcvT [Fusibacter paucivorans]